MEFDKKNVLVFGAGKSGIAAAKLLLDHHAEVILYDGNENADVEKIREQLENRENLRICCGQLPEEIKENLDLIVLSPGVPVDLPLVEEIRGRGVGIWGEVELAYECSRGRVLAITGTNGKTTTTALLGEIMKNYCPDVKVVGNIGIPYTSVADETTEDTVTVAEISSFQLETIDKFRPDVSAILNITPDHLNRHHTMENYINAKCSITKNQTPDQTCVLNYEDEVLRKFGEETSVHVLYFSSLRELEEGLYLKDGEIIWAAEGKKQSVIRTDELNILGRHNYENAMAAAGMALEFGVPLEKIQEPLGLSRL